jgi:hypothetical protein
MGGLTMGIAAYEILGAAGEWRISHDGKAENVYQTKEAAFEAAVAAASLALRQGHEIRIVAPASVVASPILIISGCPTITFQHQTSGELLRTTEYSTPRYFM